MTIRCFGDFWREWREHCELTGEPLSSYWTPAPHIVPPQPPPHEAESQQGISRKGVHSMDTPGGLLHIGDQVTCDGDGIFRRCKCGCTAFIVAPGKGPHHAALQCSACGRGGRWLSRAHLEAAA